jgi:glycosyltransferase involved in cell wall biosynthesis
MPLVTIIVPTQGRRASLANALRSALSQTFSRLEVVVVDDAIDGLDWSKRDDVSVLLEDSRIRLVPSHQGRGCAAAKNVGLAAAHGEWVCYLDDDNEYLPTKVEDQHACALSTGSPMVLCGLEVRVRGRRRLRQVDSFAFSGDEVLLRAHGDTNVMFHRRDMDVKWNEALGTVDDACYFQAFLARYALSSVPNVPLPLVIYYSHGGVRANRDFGRFYLGQRCLLARWAVRFSPRARRVLLLRSLVSFCKFRAGKWPKFALYSFQLLRVGGWREWRFVANAFGVKLPGLRRWMVT